MPRLKDPVLESEWYAVLKSEDVGTEPVPVRILQEKVVVFRTKEGIRAFKDLCIHRGSALSLGKVVDDQLICPYHGWAYNSDGDCVCIPAQRKEEKIPVRAKAIVFHGVEAYGLVWVCIGEPAGPVPSFPQFADPGFRTLIYGPYLIKATAPRIIENFLDFSHLMFVHEGILGSPEHAEIQDYKVHKQDGTLVTDEITLYAQSDFDGELVPYTMHKKAMTPMTSCLLKRNHTHDGLDAILINTVPIDEQHTLSFTIHARNYDLENDDDKYIELNTEIMLQDIRILENQTPEELPLDLQAELNHKSDQMSIAYRRWLAELNVTIGTA